MHEMDRLQQNLISHIIQKGVIFALGVLSAAFYVGNRNTPLVTDHAMEISPCNVYE